jgi:oligogalacturonide lyase
MAKGTNYGKERIDFACPMTGALICQVASNPTISTHLGYEHNPFTADSKSLIFHCYRTSERGAPRDLFRVDADGDNLIQLTDCDDLSSAEMDLHEPYAYITTKRDIIRIDLNTYEEVVLAHFDAPQSPTTMTTDGKRLYVRVEQGNGAGVLFRCNIDGTDAGEIYRDTVFNHMMASPTGNWLSWIKNDEGNEFAGQTWYVMRPDGSENHRWGVKTWSHSAWVGSTDRLMGCLLTPERGINWIGPEETEPQTIATGVYFLHGSSSRDGEWIITDTNWPNIGLQLVHVPSGRFQTVCLDRSSIGHPQCTHPHPVLSPDASMVCYNSDRSGIPQVHVAVIPEEIKEDLRTGRLTNRGRIGSREWI